MQAMGQGKSDERPEGLFQGGIAQAIGTGQKPNPQNQAGEAVEEGRNGSEIISHYSVDRKQLRPASLAS